MNTQKKNLMLSIETATRGGSLAILSEREVCAISEGGQDSSPSSALLPAVQKILDEAGVKIGEIDFLSAAVGPGSFTDLRIGLATAKGLAAVRQIPLIGVPTLEAMTAVETKTEASCVLLAAGRGEFFTQIFRRGQNKAADQMRAGQLENILSELKCEKDLRLIAPPEIVPIILEFTEQEQITNWSVITPPPNLAVCVGRIAFDLLEQNKANQNSSRLIYGREAVMLRKNA